MVDCKENYKFDLGVKGLEKYIFEWHHLTVTLGNINFKFKTISDWKDLKVFDWIFLCLQIVLMHLEQNWFDLEIM